MKSDDETVPRGSRFIYRFATSPTTNSLVVLQRKYVARADSEKSRSVLVRREQVPFACTGTDAGAEPVVRMKAGDAAGNYYKLDYDAYETTIENGYADGSDDAAFVNDHLHLLYRNSPGRNCVSTRDDSRRGALLLNPADRLTPPGFALFQRVAWFLSTSAVAAPEHDYSEMRVNVYPYAAADTPRCLLFSLASGKREADISLSDIEQLAGLPLSGHTSTSVHVTFGPARPDASK